MHYTKAPHKTRSSIEFPKLTYEYTINPKLELTIYFKRIGHGKMCGGRNRIRVKTKNWLIYKRRRIELIQIQTCTHNTLQFI